MKISIIALLMAIAVTGCATPKSEYQLADEANQVRERYHACKAASWTWAEDDVVSSREPTLSDMRKSLRVNNCRNF